MTLVTVVIGKVDLLCIPFGIGVIVRPGAVGGQKEVVKLAPLHGTCLTGHRPSSRLKTNVTTCQRTAKAASPACLRAVALKQEVAAFGRNNK